MFTRFNQTLEGLFKVASSSLSFAILLHDSHIQNAKMLKRRRDVVFSQVVHKFCCLKKVCYHNYLSIQLTALVSSFYLLLSKNFDDPNFLKQIREIGFLAHFESLLSSLGKLNI